MKSQRCNSVDVAPLSETFHWLPTALSIISTLLATAADPGAPTPAFLFPSAREPPSTTSPFLVLKQVNFSLSLLRSAAPSPRDAFGAHVCLFLGGWHGVFTQAPPHRTSCGGSQSSPSCRVQLLHSDCFPLSDTILRIRALHCPPLSFHSVCSPPGSFPTEVLTENSHRRQPINVCRLSRSASEPQEHRSVGQRLRLLFAAWHL